MGGVQRLGCVVPERGDGRSNGKGPEGAKARTGTGREQVVAPVPRRALVCAPFSLLCPLAHPRLPLVPAGPAALTSPQNDSKLSAQLPQRPRRALSPPSPPGHRPQFAPRQGPARCSVPRLRRRTRPQRRSWAALSKGSSGAALRVVSSLGSRESSNNGTSVVAELQDDAR